GGRAVQIIAPELRLAMPRIDLQDLPGPAREREIRELAEMERLRPFDLARGPLVRATLLRSGEEEHAVLLTLHHVVADGWSMGVLIGEIAPLCRACLGGETSHLPALPIQYADFAVWQRQWLRGEVLEAELAYWRER